MKIPDYDKLQIVHYPDPVLRRKAKEIRDIGPELRRVAERMNELMVQAAGMGLAANQVAWPYRLFIVNATGEPGAYEAYINPEIVSRTGRMTDKEGCLSLPGIEASVTRPQRVVMEAATLDGKRVRVPGEDLLARAFAHEIDHLDGTLFIDRVGKAGRLMIRSRLGELERRYEQLRV